MKTITSKTNEAVLRLKKLASDKEYRYEKKLFMVEGLRALDGAAELEELFVREDAPVPDIKCPRTYLLGKSAFGAVASTENSQGIIAVVRFNMLSPENIARNSKYVLLDRIQDPGNAGAILRSACGLGFKGAVITPGCADPFSPKAARSAAGALWKIDIIKAETVEQLAPFTIIAADARGENADGYAWPEGFLLAVGNEGAGLSGDIRRLALASVRIPMSGGMESLNAAVSAGILMYLASSDPKASCPGDY